MPPRNHPICKFGGFWHVLVHCTISLCPVLDMMVHVELRASAVADEDLHLLRRINILCWSIFEAIYVTALKALLGPGIQPWTMGGRNAHGIMTH